MRETHQKSQRETTLQVQELARLEEVVADNKTKAEEATARSEHNVFDSCTSIATGYAPTDIAASYLCAL